MSDDRQTLLPSPLDATGSSGSDLPESCATSERSIVSPEDAITDPAHRSKGERRAAFFSVIITEALERTAFYSLTGNMVLFLNTRPLVWASYHAAIALFLLQGLSYIFTLLGGWIADALFGKFPTILVAFVIYIIGCAIWPTLYPYPNDVFSTCSMIENKSHWCVWNNVTNTSSMQDIPLYQENCSYVVFIAIIIVACGYGCVRVNIIPFGAHQVEHEGPVAMRFYFNWLYWFINVGSLIAFGVMGYIQQEISFFYGYLVPSLTLIIAVALFLSGSRYYVKKWEAHGSVLTNIACICRSAAKVYCHENRRRDAEVLTSGIRAQDHANQAGCCIDYAKTRFGGEHSESSVNDVKALGRVCLVFLSMVPYWTVYYQMQTTFMVQGLHMRLGFGNVTYTNSQGPQPKPEDDKSFKIPASWLTMFDVIFVLILLPLLDRVIYPRLDRAGYSPSLRFRIMIGMIFTIIAMCIAGCVERNRLGFIWKDGTTSPITITQFIGCTPYYASDMSVLWQIPQYAFVGISEIFTSTAGLELAYIAAPHSMKGIIMGLYWFCEGLGSLLGSATIAIFETVWFENFDYGNINCQSSPFTDNKAKCHLDYYFFTLAGFQVLGILFFVVVAWMLNIGQSIPLRVQEQGVTVVRPSRGTPRPVAQTPPTTDGAATSMSPLLGNIQRRNTDSRSPVYS